jgi:hypothetical protein
VNIEAEETWSDKATYGLDGDDLAGKLLHLVQLGEEIPIAALGDNHVGGIDGHLEEGLLGGNGCWQLASNDDVLDQLHIISGRIGESSWQVNMTGVTHVQHLEKHTSHCFKTSTSTSDSRY